MDQNTAEDVYVNESPKTWKISVIAWLCLGSGLSTPLLLVFSLFSARTSEDMDLLARVVPVLVIVLSIATIILALSGFIQLLMRARSLKEWIINLILLFAGLLAGPILLICGISFFIHNFRLPA
jgi:hypothetical protein